MRRAVFFLLLAVLAVASVRVDVHGASQSVSLRYIQPEHKAILEKWLRRQPQLRVAIEADCKNRQGLMDARLEHGENYHPYYAVGDFNRDGREDFAVVLISKQRRARNFSIAIFNGPFTGTPVFYTGGVDLSAGGLVFRADNRLVAGVFQTDDCVVLKPKGRGYVMADCL